MTLYNRYIKRATVRLPHVGSGSTWTTVTKDGNFGEDSATAVGVSFSDSSQIRTRKKLYNYVMITNLEKIRFWSYNSRFLLHSSDGRIRIWRQQHEIMDQCCLESMVQANDAYVIVSGII